MNLFEYAIARVYSRMVRSLIDSEEIAVLTAMRPTVKRYAEAAGLSMEELDRKILEARSDEELDQMAAASMPGRKA